MDKIQKMTAVCLLVWAVLPAPASTEGFYASAGVQGGAVIWRQALPLAGLELAAGWGLDTGPGTLELGAALGFVTGGQLTVVPAALTAGYGVPVGGLCTLTPGLRLGGAIANGAVEPFFGARLALELHQPAAANGKRAPWAFYISGGADLYIEATGLTPMPLGSAGIKYSIGE